jgi:m7GpppX diphosphatase
MDYKKKYKKYKNKYLEFKNNIQMGGGKYKLKLDTYDDYIKYIKENEGKDCGWIYDIIDKHKETDNNKLLFEDDDFVLVTEMDMKDDDISTFHLLAFPKDKSIKSIRDLTSEHIPLLKKMAKLGKKYITDNYEINDNEIETHFHYPPGVMLLHMHFELVNSNKQRRPLREHSVYEVIQNLLTDSEYYKKFIFEILIKK